MDFEEKIKNVKSIIEKLNDPKLSLKEGMNLYKEGISELREAEKILSEAKIVFNELKAEEIKEEIEK